MSVASRINPHFISAWVRNPLQVGAIAPSSNRLAGQMAAQVGESSELVVELGAGTGAVTRALLNRGIPATRLIAVERDERLAAQLSLQFPRLKVLNGDAGRLRQLLGRRLDRPVDAVVSSLPLLSLPGITRARAVVEAFAILRPGGRFIQFTYGPRPPIPEAAARSLGVVGERAGLVLRNLPPAAVWVYRHR